VLLSVLLNKEGAGSVFFLSLVTRVLKPYIQHKPLQVSQF